MGITDWAGLLSPVGCVIFLIIAFVKGWLVQGSVIDRLTTQWERERAVLVAQWNDRLNEAHGREALLWKVVDTSEETRRDALDQLKTRQTVDEVVVRAVAALPKPQAAERAD